MKTRTFLWYNRAPVEVDDEQRASLERASKVAHEVGAKSRPAALLLEPGARPTMSQVRAVRAATCPPRRRSPLIDDILSEREALRPLKSSASL